MLSEWCDLIEEEHVSRISRKTTLIGAVVALALIGALAAGFVLLRPPRTNAWEFIGPNRAEIVTLAFDPATPTTLYAGADDGVYKSEDGGVTWRTANRRLPGGADARRRSGSADHSVCWNQERRLQERQRRRHLACYQQWTGRTSCCLCADA